MLIHASQPPLPCANRSTRLSAAWQALAHSIGGVFVISRLTSQACSVALAVLLGLALAVGCLGASNTHAATPAVETLVENTATATYLDVPSGRAESTSSNTVRAYVLPLPAYVLTSPQSRVGAPGTLVYFSHTIRNTGNVPLEFAIRALNYGLNGDQPQASTGGVLNDALSGSPNNPASYDISSFAIYADINGDGVPDSTTPITATPSAIPAGGTFQFVVAARVPAGALAGQVDEFGVELRPTTTNYVGRAIGTVPLLFPNGGVSYTNENRLTVSNLAVVAMTKSIWLTGGPAPSDNTNPPNSPASPGAGQLRMSLTFTNTGAADATDLDITDVIGQGPTLGFAYVPESARYQSFQNLTDAAGGDPAGITYEVVAAAATGPWTIRARIASLPRNATQTLSFNVVVLSTAAPGTSTTTNTATYSYDPDGPGVAGRTTPEPTNPTSYLVPPINTPDLTIRKTHVGNFTTLADGTFNISVRNDGNLVTTGPITVVDTLPAGLTFVRAGTPTWPCTAAGQVITCTSNQRMSPRGEEFFSVVVRPTQTGSFINRVVVSGGGERVEATGNNTAEDQAIVNVPVDLAITKTHVGDFTVGQVGRYEITVRNIGSIPSNGVITVTDELPPWVEYVRAGAPGAPGAISGGQGWVCEVTSRATTNRHLVTCTTSAVLASQASAQPISIYVIPQSRAPRPQATNTAVVNGGGETPGLEGNNVVNDPTTILGPTVDYATVSGTVWLDINHNRIREVGENLLADWIVEIVNASGVVVGTARTNVDGFYTITRIAPGSGYKIVFREPTTTRPITGSPVDGEGGARYSYGVVQGGVLDNITLAAGDNIIEQSLPLDPSGIVYDSQTRLPVAGAFVTIFGPPGFDPDLHLVGGRGNVRQITGPFGFYQYLFLNTAPTGTYGISVEVPAGYQPFDPNKALLPPQTGTGALACVVPQPFCFRPGNGTAPGQVFEVQPTAFPPRGAQSTRYFVTFELNPTGNLQLGVVNNNIPIDPFTAATLLIQKSVDKATAEIADYLVYTIRITNTSLVPAGALGVNDTIPFGFQYIKGSARFALNAAAAGVPLQATQQVGLPIADPAGGAGPNLVFGALGTLLSGQTAVLSYRLRVGVGAPLGDGINRAQGTAAGGTRSNQSSVKVNVTQGVFTDRAYIAGKVFLDCNRDRMQGEKEVGIPGVRIFLEDGTNAVTDAEGKYSFYGVVARTHVVKVDVTSLPPGAELIALTNRNAGTADSRFADVKRGELHRADFAEGSCTPDIKANVKARREQGQVQVAETDAVLRNRLDPKGERAAVSDLKSKPAQGTVSGGTGDGLVNSQAADVPSYNSVIAAGPDSRAGLPGALTSRNSNLPPEPVRLGAGGLAISRLSDELAKETSNELGFVGIKDRDTVPFRQIPLRVKAPQGSLMKVTVNGRELPETQIAARATDPVKKLDAVEYLGVALHAGENKVEVTVTDPFGNARGKAAITIIAPDNLAKLVIDAPNTAVADGGKPIKVTIRLEDDKGVPVTVRTPITLEDFVGENGVRTLQGLRWLNPDIDPKEPGIQLFVEGGKVEALLSPPQNPGDEFVRVSSGVLKVQKKISFLPELRPLIAAGVLEGAINLRKLSLKNLIPVQKRDGFEEEMRWGGASGDNDKREANSRAALFLKGKVLGEYLLTLAYDSDKPTKERLFRDIQPDEYYPIYGDSSVRGFDGQSTSRLYLRIDKNKNYALFGDFTTGTSNEGRQLSAYSRAMTGSKLHLEGARYSLNTFASRESMQQIAEELPAAGISGPYVLKSNVPAEAIRSGSERVDVLVRDRNQRSLILSTIAKSRNSDYEINYFSKEIVFKAPLPSQDENGNPVSIRITYEVDTGGSQFWVAGVDAQIKLTENIELGGVYVRDQNPNNKATLSGLNTTIKLTDKTFVIAEAAVSKKVLSGTGHAERIELRHSDEKFEARAHLQKVGDGFDNGPVPLTQNLGIGGAPTGRVEGGLRASYAFSPSTKIAAEYLHNQDNATGAKRDGVRLALSQRLGEGVNAEVFVRHSTESGGTTGAVAGQDANFTTIGAKIVYTPEQIKNLSLRGEYEQDVRDAEKRRLGVGVDYTFENRAKIYARHERSSSLTGPYALATQPRNYSTVVGLSGDYMKDGQAFSEYRLRDALDGRSAEASIGLRNLWEVAEGLRLNTSAERIKTLQVSGATALADATSLTGAIEYTANPLWKGSSRLEWRTSADQDSWLGSAGGAVRLSRDWSALARASYQRTESKGITPSDAVRTRVEGGFAWRDTESNKLSALTKLEHRTELNTDPTFTLKRALTIGSAHMNYQPNRSTILTGRYAGKYVNEDAGGLLSKSSAHLVSGRITFDITNRWDIGLLASSIWSGSGFNDRRYGIGAEVGYLVWENLWISAGYNVFGFRDRDLSGSDYTDKGWYLRLRYKFDETLFDNSRDAGLRGPGAK